MISTSKSFITSALRISFILGFKLRCIFLNGLAFSSNYILHVHIEGLIPLISATVHPIASLYSLRVSTNLASWSWSNCEEITTGNVSTRPKNAYFSSDGRGFNYSFGVWTLDGRGTTSREGNFSICDLHLLVSIKRVDSNKKLSSATTESNWTKHASRGSEKEDKLN